jgi:chitinase
MAAAKPRARRRSRILASVEHLEARTMLSTLTVGPVADTYVRGGTFASTNFGRDTTLAVANQTSATYDRESYLRFDLKGVTTPVTKATLQLVPSSLSGDLAATSYRITLVSDTGDNWVEGNGGTDNNPTGELIWSNRPAVGTATVIFAGSSLTVGKPIRIDVTALVKNAANANGLFSLRIDAPTEVSSSQLIGFWSREAATAANRPALTLESTNVEVQATWPDRTFAPYVDATNWPLFDFVSMAKTQNVKFFTLAFIVADGANQPSWGGYYSLADKFRADEISALRALGGDVMISFGGAAGTELAVAIKDVNTLTNAYQSVIDAYKLTHIDFDIEGAWVADKASIDRRSLAIKNLQDRANSDGRELAVWFTLPVLPQGLTADGVYVVQSALKAGVRIAGVNVMAMDYGDGAAPNPEGQMGKYAIDAANSLFSQLKSAYTAAGQTPTDAELWSKVGVTPMIGQNDVPTERFYQADATALLNFATSKQLGYLAFWSANRDNGSVPSGQLSGNGSGVVQTPFEFSKILQPFTGNNIPRFSVDDVSVVEGDAGTKSLVFNVMLSNASSAVTTVKFATVDGTASAGTDYQALSGTLTFAAGETKKSVAVNILGELLAEKDETFTLVLSQPTGAGLLKSVGTATIFDDDAPPAITIDDVSLAEGQSGTSNAVFTVKLSRAPKTGETISVIYATVDQTAKTPSDYVALSGTLVFTAGQISKILTVLVNGDTLAESNETFTVNLSSASGATLAKAQGIGTILDDDTPSDQVKFEVTSQWDTGFIAQVTIKNTTNKTWVDWSLEWDALFAISSIWSAQLTSVSNGHFLFKPADWTKTLAPGASITFGFQGVGKPTSPTGVLFKPIVG